MSAPARVGDEAAPLPLFSENSAQVFVAGAAPLRCWGRIDSRSGPLPYDEWLRAVWTDETNIPPRSDYGPLSNGASGVSCLLAPFASRTISVMLFFSFPTRGKRANLSLRLFVHFPGT